MVKRSSRSLARRRPRFKTVSAPRAALALALAFVLLNSSLAAMAQGNVTRGAGASPKEKAYTATRDSDAYVIHKSDDGGTTCRDASPEEKSAMAEQTGALSHDQIAQDIGLHQINHLDEVGPNSPNDPQAVGAEAVGMKIILRGTSQLEQNPAAKNAFIAAAARWEAIIKNPITIVLDVDFGATRFGQQYPNDEILGSTSAGVAFIVNYPQVRTQLINRASSSEELSLFNSLPSSSVPTDLGPTSDIIVVTPIARVFNFLNPHADPNPRPDPTGPGGKSVDAFGNAPSIGFNSESATFDFNPVGGITQGQMDFDAVAVHEIGHALGFVTQVGERELDPSEDVMLSTWDLFRFRPNVAQQGGFSVAPRILSSGGEHRHYSGSFQELQLSTARGDNTGGDEEQASHWKDDMFVPYIGIMDPTIPPGRREEITANDLRAIDFFGYQTQTIAAPANDNFSAPVQLQGATGTTTGSNNGATKEGGEPSHADNGGGAAVWYNWTAPATGSATFDTLGSSFDTTLDVYVGGSVNALSLIVENDDISPLNAPPPRTIQSRVTFNATAGTTYRIAVDGDDGDIGNITLNWTAAAAPPPQASFQFANAAPSVS